MSTTHSRTGTPVNTPRQVLFASLIGTTIEFFDFYIYATAAVLVFPRLFFPAVRPGVGHARVAGHLWHRVSGPAGGLCALRSFWRSHWPQDDAGHRAFDHGDIDSRHWRAADL